MKRKFLTWATIGAIAAGTLWSQASMAQVGVSISIGEPGFYGQIDLGDYPPPSLIYSRPVVIARGPVYDDMPIYLRVPYAHYRDWRHYCGRYDACGRPVYFVRDSWYKGVYVPRYREHHGYGPPGGRPDGRNRRDHDRDDKRDKRDKHDKHDDRGGPRDWNGPGPGPGPR